MWLFDGEKYFEDVFICFDRIHERDRRADGQTDGQTLHDGVGRTYASHGAAEKNKLGLLSVSLYDTMSV